MNSNIERYENSQQDGRPIECYKFINGAVSYLYTSASDDVDIPIQDDAPVKTETYFAEYIRRETLKPTEKGDCAALVVTASKDFVVGKLYQGPPPEQPVKLILYRLHDQDHAKRDIVFRGRVSQASFKDSECELTVKAESWVNKEIPNGNRQFTCCSVLFDSKCRLREEDWAVQAFIDKADGTALQSTTFASKPDGYFANGFVRYNGNIRQIDTHQGEVVQLKYPFASPPRHEVSVSPGCDGLFATCARRFGNTLNFTGCLYVPPTNPNKKDVGRGVYWVDSQVVQRDTDGFVGKIEL